MFYNVKDLNRQSKIFNLYLPLSFYFHEKQSDFHLNNGNFRL